MSDSCDFPTPETDRMDGELADDIKRMTAEGIPLSSIVEHCLKKIYQFCRYMEVKTAEKQETFDAAYRTYLAKPGDEAFTKGQLWACEQKLARAEEQVKMDTECIDRIRKHALEAEAIIDQSHKFMEHQNFCNFVTLRGDKKCNCGYEDIIIKINERNHHGLD